MSFSSITRKNRYVGPRHDVICEAHTLLRLFFLYVDGLERDIDINVTVWFEQSRQQVPTTLQENSSSIECNHEKRLSTEGPDLELFWNHVVLLDQQPHKYNIEKCLDAKVSYTVQNRPVGWVEDSILCIGWAWVAFSSSNAREGACLFCHGTTLTGKLVEQTESQRKVLCFLSD